jgi:hypothetical protein
MIIIILLTRECLVYVLILDNYQIVFDFVNQRIEPLHHMLRDVFHLKYHSDTENMEIRNAKKEIRDFKFFILECKVNSVAQDHSDQYSCPKRNIFVAEQLSIVHRYSVVEEFSNDQAIKLKTKIKRFHSDAKKK